MKKINKFTGTEVLLSGKWKMAYLKNGVKKNYTCADDIYNDNINIIDATVPGNIELDLYNAGLCADPLFGNNPDTVRRETENLHSYYFREFIVDEIKGLPFLTFEGIDCYSDIFLNGQKIAETDNMLIEHKIAVGDYLKEGKNHLFVHIKPTLVEAGKYDFNPLLSPGNASYAFLYMRKATHMCGWDIMPRFISAGLWRDVWLTFEPEEDYIEEFYINTASVTAQIVKAGFDFGSAPNSFGGNDAALELFFKFRGDLDNTYSLSLDGVCKDNVIHYETHLIFTATRRDFKVENPYLWWPAGQGDPDMYDFTLTLFKNGKEVDRREFRQGLCTSELVFHVATEENDKNKFDVLVNGRKIYCKGSNWVPADVFHSRDREQIKKKLPLVSECGCNMLRCWGGNVYEDDIFYDYCDEHGIMIWQDFAFACTKYPTDDEFCERVRKETIAVVKRLRHHACITLWAGDNENDLRYWDWEARAVDPNNPFNNRVSREILPRVLAVEDPYRPYLPSSPYLSPEISANPDAVRPETHVWTTCYFKSSTYKDCKSNFISEVGYFGSPSPESIKQFISPEKLWPPLDNDEWDLHSTSPIPEMRITKPFRIPAHIKEMQYMFDGEPQSLSEFAVKSQITHAEALKFLIECFRSQKWEKTGLLWWNICDGWPQFSDAAVDYFYRKKLAFYYIKNSQQDVCIMLSEPECGKQSIVLANDTAREINITYKIRDVDTNEVIAEGSAYCDANLNACVGEIDYSSNDKRFYLIEWSGDANGKNHYLAGEPMFSDEKYLDWMQKSGLFDAWLLEASQW